MYSYRTVVLVFLILKTSLSFSQVDVKKVFNPSEKKLQEKWDKFFKELKPIANKAPKQGYCITLLHKGEIIKEFGHGYANIEKKVEFRKNTISNWASISKLLVVVAILQLQEKKQLSLGDPITRFIPELREASKKFGGFDSVKIYHLLNHTSQLRMRNALKIKYKETKKRHGKDIRMFFLRQDFSKYFKLFKLDTIPGIKYKYSNFAYNWLGEVVTRAAGESYESYVMKNIFTPLGMKDSYFGKTSPYLIDKVARAYRLKKDTLISDIHDENSLWATAAQALKSTQVDMHKFLSFIASRSFREKNKKRCNQVLKSETIDKYILGEQLTLAERKKFYTVSLDNKTAINEDHFTFDFWKYKKHGDTQILAYGYLPYYQSFLLYNHAYDFGIIYSHNVKVYKGSQESKIFGYLYNFIFRFAARDANIRLETLD